MSFFDYIPGFDAFKIKLHHKRHFKKRTPYWNRKRRYLFGYKKKNWKRRSLPILRKWKQRWKERRRRRMKLRPKLRRRLKIRRRIRRSRIRYRRPRLIQKRLDTDAYSFGGGPKTPFGVTPRLFRGQEIGHHPVPRLAIRVGTNRRTRSSSSSLSAISYNRVIGIPFSADLVEEAETRAYETTKFFRTKLRGRKDKRRKGKRQENQKLSFSERVFYRTLQSLFKILHPPLLWFFILFHNFLNEKVIKPARDRFSPMYTEYSQIISAFFISFRVSLGVYLAPLFVQIDEIMHPVVDFFDAQNFLVTLVEQASFLFFSGGINLGTPLFFYTFAVFFFSAFCYSFVWLAFFKDKGRPGIRVTKEQTQLIIMLADQRPPLFRMRSRIIAEKQAKGLPKEDIAKTRKS